MNDTIRQQNDNFQGTTRSVSTNAAPLAQNDILHQNVSATGQQTTTASDQSGTQVSPRITRQTEGQAPALPVNTGQSVQSQQTNQAQTTQEEIAQQYISGDKERIELSPRTDNFSESAPVVEIKEHHEFEPEVEGWLEKLEQGHEIKLPEPVMHDGRVIVADVEDTTMSDKIVLPLTKQGLAKGMQQKVVSSARWLAEWASRLIKMFGNQVQYKESQPAS